MRRAAATHRRAGGLRRHKRAVDTWVRSHLAYLQVAVATVGVLLVAASLYVIAGGRGHTSTLAQLPPTPPSPSSAAPPTGSSAPLPAAARKPHPSGSSSPAPGGECAARETYGVGGAAPVHICIPAIGVDADMMQLGLNPDRTVETPPLREVGLAGWYKYSPAPGVIGPSIILGHVDSAQYGKGVFYDLGKLHPGDRFVLSRADGMSARFRVDKVEQYPKSEFPAQRVYGNTSDAQIRLITCGGEFDPSSGSYEDNIIAFGTLVSLRPTA